MKLRLGGWLSAWGLIVWLASGCDASTGFLPLNRPALRASQPRTLAKSRSKTPEFVGRTTTGVVTGALFGVAGAIVSEASAESTGDRLQRDGGLHDPAGRIVGVLTAALSKKYALEVKGTSATITGASKPKAIVAAAPGADLVLHIRTSQWGFGPASAGTYGIVYDGTLTLIDARSGAVVAEGICSFRPVDAGDAPTYDQLMANNASVLREMVDAVTESCIDDYRKRILGIYQ